MIIKFYDRFYNIDGWKEIYLDDEFLVINYTTSTEEIDGFLIKLDPEYQVDKIVSRHDEWDYKDARWMRRDLANIIYSYFKKELARDTNLIDLDLVYKRSLNKAYKNLLKEYQDDRNS